MRRVEKAGKEEHLVNFDISIQKKRMMIVVILSSGPEISVNLNNFRDKL